jgi:hypothetical protein
MSMLVSLLIWLIVAAIVLWLVNIIVGNLPVSPTVRMLIVAVVALLILIAFLNQTGLVHLSYAPHLASTWSTRIKLR